MREYFNNGHPDDAALLDNGFVYSRPVREGRGVRSVDEPFPTVVRTAHGRPTPRYLNRPHKADPVPALQTAVLTVRQMSRLQTFPDSWMWTGNKHDRLQMIANAVPCALAESLGRVILEREHGRSAPLVIGEFLQWLARRGRSTHSARNVKSLLIRARKLLGGRTFADPALEQAVLEALPEVQQMRKNTLSDLRQALRLYAQYQASPQLSVRRPKPKKKRAEHVVSLKDYARQMRDADPIEGIQETRKLASG
jgi:DNA (cytosine-5)-methyltransferase 1